MITIHIHELNSNQAIEITAKNAERAIIDYAFHNVYNRGVWTDTRLYYYREPRTPEHLKEINVGFEGERMTATRLNGSVIWLVEWTNV